MHRGGRQALSERRVRRLAFGGSIPMSGYIPIERISYLIPTPPLGIFYIGQECKMSTITRRLYIADGVSTSDGGVGFWTPILVRIYDNQLALGDFTDEQRDITILATPVRFNEFAGKAFQVAEVLFAFVARTQIDWNRPGLIFF